MCEMSGIKRGMVFFLEKPSTTSPIPPNSDTLYQKKRPYMVLSSNKCNEVSQLIHVAPIISREYDPKRWFCVPFKACGNKSEVVDIAQIMLIDKKICTKEAYSETFTRDIIDNETLFEGIKFALLKQMGFVDDYAHIVYKTQSDTKQDIPVQPINLVINLNGVPVNVEASNEDGKTSVNLNYNKSSVDAIMPKHNIEAPKTIEDVAEEPEHDKKIRTVQMVTDEEVRLAKGITDDDPRIVREEQTKSDITKQQFTHEEIEKIKAYIRRFSKKFNGSMSASDLAEICGCSTQTIYRLTNIICNEELDTKTRSSLPKCMDEEFISDYEKFGTAYVLDKYKRFGFKHRTQVYAAIATRRKMKDKEKVTT